MPRKVPAHRLGQLGRGQRAGVGRDQARQHPCGHPRQPHPDHRRGELLREREHRPRVTALRADDDRRFGVRGGPAPPGTSAGGLVGAVGPVVAGPAVAADLAGDGGRRSAQPSRDLGVAQPSGQPRRDVTAVLVGQPASGHGPALPSSVRPSVRSWAVHCNKVGRIIAFVSRTIAIYSIVLSAKTVYRRLACVAVCRNAT